MKRILVSLLTGILLVAIIAGASVLFNLLQEPGKWIIVIFGSSVLCYTVIYDRNDKTTGNEDKGSL